MLQIRNLSIEFTRRSGPVLAVRNVDLAMRKGEILGLAGESGCGKTTTAMAIPRLLPVNARVTSGEILFEGANLLSKSEQEMGRIRWKEISVVFQGAMNALNPVKRAGAQVAEAILQHDKDARPEEVRDRVGRLFEMVGISAKRATHYPHEFSGGMRQRAMIAMAIACNPKLVIADEPITALDVMIQAQILDLMKELCDQLGLAMVLISHDLSVIAETCDRVAIMYAGCLVEVGPAREVFAHPAHPYTAALIGAFPNIHGERRFVGGIPGTPPDLRQRPPGCSFSDRCVRRGPRCGTEEPVLMDLGGGHAAACCLIGRAGK